MTRWLYLGSRRFEVAWASGRAFSSPDVARRAGDQGATLAALRRLATEPSNKAALRRLLAASPEGAAARGWDDETLLTQVARLIASGQVRLVEQRRGPTLEATGGAASDTTPPPPSATASTTSVQEEAALTWIEIQLIGEDDKPVPGARYRIELPDGSTREGALDAQGLARFNDIDPGSCVVTFRDLDEDAWVSA